MKTFLIKLFCLTGIAALICAFSLHATELTWDANTTISGAQDGQGSWSTAASNTNWWNGANNVTWNNATPDSAIFGANNGTAAATVTVASGTTNTVGNISFGPSASGSYIIAGGTASTSKLNLSGNPTITVSNGVTATISVLFTGTGFTKAGDGTIIFTADNTYTNGPVVVSDGILQFGNGGTSGAVGPGSKAITDNSQLLFNRSDTGLTLSGVISGSGSVTQIGSGSTSLTGTNTYQGLTTISNGTININGNSTLGDGTGTLNLSGGTLTTTADRAVNSAPVANPINLTADSAITTTSASSSGATVNLNLNNNSISGSAGTLTFSNSASSGNGIFAPRFSGSGFNFGQPIIIANGTAGTTRLDSFNTNGTTQTFSGAISGDGGYRRNANSVSAAGTTVFSANNTYTGLTEINRGILLVNGSLAVASSVNVGSSNNKGTLGGNGTINGPVTVQANGTLSAGTGIGILTISNSLTFLTGSTDYAELNKTSATNDLIRGLTTVTYAGALVVTNLSGTLALNDTFRLFNAVRYDGSFDTTNLPALGAGLVWDITGLTVDGTIKVISSQGNPPQIGTVSISGTNILLTGSGGTVGATYYVLTSTNIALPLTNWTSIATNQFITGGNFNFTNAIVPHVPMLFYILQLPPAN